MSEPLPNEGWSREKVTVKNALICPPLEAKYMQECGVLSPDGDVEQAATWREGKRYTLPVKNRPEVTHILSGRYMWGGMLFGHFGHFIAETISRFWAAEGEQLDGLVFIARHGALKEFNGYRQTFLDLLGIDIPAIIIHEATEVEELMVPGQGFGLGKIAQGTPEFHAMMRKMSESIEPKGDEKIYISRTQFNGKGGILGEELLEKNMEAQGYTIVHPQRMGLKEQFAMFKAAKSIVGLDGSAFHVSGFVAPPDQRAAIILRRNHHAHRNIVGQLTSFMSEPPAVINALAADWMPEAMTFANHLTWGEIDFKVLGQRLLNEGFIEDSSKWTVWEDFPSGAVLDKAEETSNAKLVRRVSEDSDLVDKNSAGAKANDSKVESATSFMPKREAKTPDGKQKVDIVGLCRFSMLGRGDWRAYRGQPDENLAEIYKQKAEELFEPSRIQGRLDCFRELTLRSMKFQSDQDFHFFVVSSDQMPEKYRKQLEEMCAEVKQVTLRFMKPIHISEAQKIIYEELGLEHENCMQFRLDDDDCVSQNFIRRARRNATYMWEHANFAMSFAQQYYCITDGPTEGIYNWFSPFFSAGCFVRHKHKSVFDFGHYGIQARLLSVVDPHFPNIVTHNGTNDTPRHEAKILKKRGMKLADKVELQRVYERHFSYLTDEGLRLSTFGKMVEKIKES